MTRAQGRQLSTGPDWLRPDEIQLREQSGPHRRVALPEGPERRHREPPARETRGEARESTSARQSPPVNPYAVIALVAALLAVFPVAIVFGFMAFSRRGGRAVAFWALLLGLAEVAALVGLVVLTGKSHTLTSLEHRITDTQSAATSDPAPSMSALTATTLVAPPSTTPAPAAAADPSAKPVLGGACATSQVGHFSIAVNGQQVLCHTVQGAVQWDKVGTMAAHPHESGSPCDPSTDSALTGKTATGAAVMCITSSTSADSRAGIWQPAT